MNTSPKSRKKLFITITVVVAIVIALGVAFTQARPTGTEGFQGFEKSRETLQVALLANGPLTDWGFNYSHAQAIGFTQKQLGEQIFARALGDVPETGDAERIMRRLINSGVDMIIAASFGYQDSTVKLAEEYPNVNFLQAWGFKPAPNLKTYSSRMYEAWYVMGIVAGRMTKSGQLGIVAAHPIPPMKWQMNAYIRGARSVNPAVEGRVTFINHWFDPSLAAEATDALIAQGVDVLCGILDNSVAVAQTAEKRGVYLIGHNADLSSFAPNSCLVGTEWLWGKLYTDVIEKQFTEGLTSITDDVNGGFKEGYVGITGFNKVVPEEVKQEALHAIEAIKRGEIDVYAGPIRDNKGAIVVNENESLTHNQIMGIDWLIEGIR